MDRGHVPNRQFKQRHILSCSGSLAGSHPTHGLENGPFDPKNDEPKPILDEMYVGGNPRPQDGQKHKRGKGTSKQ
jgi:hypothetical protein